MNQVLEDRIGDKMTYIDYQCSKCSEQDRVKLFPGEQAPAAINCWHCHAGYRTELSDMLINGVGMFQLQPPPEAREL